MGHIIQQSILDEGKREREKCEKYARNQEWRSPTQKCCRKSHEISLTDVVDWPQEGYCHEAHLLDKQMSWVSR